MLIFIKSVFNKNISHRYEQESKVQFVVDAVYAFALALHNLYQDICKNFKSPGVCPAMTQYDSGDFYKKYLLNVSFTGKYKFFNPKDFKQTILL